ncbi:AI-2E family transporter [Elioraea sp.]|uniref:AI-2E family transporter n=1 Tax=Elioraea sp. TaxID=2185103 RepID=UPI0021DD502C|nr:AI-2E family transporter [Elioraea sp.]GIX08506.1 MAG: AI-2E family transporter [Elioraea sp.]
MTAEEAESGRRQRLYLILGALAAVALALHLFASILLPFVLGALIAYLLDPLADRLEAVGVPRSLAAVALVVALLALIILFLLLIYPLILAQLNILLSLVPQYLRALGNLMQEALVWLEERLGPEVVDRRLRELATGQINTMLGWVTGAVATVLGGGVQLFNVLMIVVVTPIVTFYLLRDWPKMVASVDSWVPRRYIPTVRELAREIDRILSAWVRGQALVCLIFAVFYAVALTAAGLQLGLIVGLTAGLISFIPYVGTLSGFVISVGMAMVQFADWRDVALIAAIFVTGNIVEGYVIYPRLLGDRVELHAVWVLFALFAGGALLGFIGVLLAVPAAAAIGVVARYWLKRYRASALYRDEGGA